MARSLNAFPDQDDCKTHRQHIVHIYRFAGIINWLQGEGVLLDYQGLMGSSNRETREWWVVWSNSQITNIG